ncbi:MAG: hypothetical protein HFH76_07425 [Lachnospiraceae bacterium]|nr:hypothetical protein [Lachnospiraceae bacterium]
MTALSTDQTIFRADTGSSTAELNGENKTGENQYGQTHQNPYWQQHCKILNGENR